MKKQTISNNPMLAASKRLFNAKIYKAISTIMNHGFGGDLTNRTELCRVYLSARGMPATLDEINAALGRLNAGASGQ